MHSSNTFPHFPSDCCSLLCRFLTRDIFDALKKKQTSYGFTLAKAIHSGVVNLDSSIGVYAGDEESYTLFSPLFDPIIEAYHGFGADAMHVSDFDPSHLKAGNPDPKGKYILSTRIRVGRNLAQFPLGPAISKAERNEVEKKVSESLKGLSGELKGRYYPLEGMNEKDREQLISDHFLFKAGDRFLEAAGLNRDWPEGRGIYHNDAKRFLVWINEEDQLRIISMQEGGDIKAVFTRLAEAVHQLGTSLDFLESKHLGYLTSCPTNLGTAMRASVHIRLPKLAADMSKFQAIAERYHLQIRGTDGEHSESSGGVYDISNKRRLGVSEVACVQDMYDGVVALIAAEEER